jgi:predicted RNase H-like HicB family nuclease
VPTLPGCVTSGETVDEVIAMAREGVEFYFKELPTSQRI